MRTTVFVTPASSAEGHAWGARSLSVALHVGVIALAVWSTQRPRVAPVAGRDSSTILTWPRAPSRHGPPQPPAPAPPEVVYPGPINAPPLPPVEIPPPAIATTASADPFAVAGAAVAAPVTLGPPSPVPPAAAVMDVRTVEEPPVLLSHPEPGYPELLRRAGIEGRVLVEAIVDTTGDVAGGSLRVVSSTHALFVPEAIALVRGSRYRPARFGGRPVRVRIQVPVNFALRR